MAAKTTNYFKQNIDKFNTPEFISLITPDQIQRQAKRIVKELVKGDIEFEQYGQYFLDMKFMENLIIGISNELDDYLLYYNAVKFYKDFFPTTPNINIKENRLQCICYVYQVILGKLNAVKVSGNIGYLTDTSALLNNYIHHHR